MCAWSVKKRWPLSEFDRMMSKISPCPNTGCWFWMDRSTNGRGYGRVYYQGKSCQAHRAYYELLVGPIPDGLELDHKCRVTMCVNPDHLEPVTHRTNVRRGDAMWVPGALRAAITHCLRGHAYEGRNVIWYRGRRRCRECSRIRDRMRNLLPHRRGRPR